MNDVTERSETIEAAEVLASKVEKYTVVKDETHAALVGEFRARLNAHIKALDTERLEMGEGARRTLARINEKYNAKINELKGYLAQVDSGLRTYLAEQRRKAEEAERARRQAEIEAASAREAELAQAAELGIEAPPPPPPEPLPPAIVTNITGTAGSKVGTREVWKYRIVDIKKVPEQYLVPPEERVNKAVLNALAKSQKENAKVKGIEFYAEDTIQSRIVQ